MRLAPYQETSSDFLAVKVTGAGAFVAVGKGAQLVEGISTWVTVSKVTARVSDLLAVWVDFGVAKTLAQSVNIEVGTIRGKVAYVAPEHVLGAPIDQRADVFSLGVCLYEALLGRLPYEGETDVAVLAARLKADFVTPREVDPDFSEEFERIVMWAMAADPEKRCPDAETLRLEIVRYLHSMGYDDRASQRADWVNTLFPNVDPAEYTGTRTLNPTNSDEWADLLFGANAARHAPTLCNTLREKDCFLRLPTKTNKSNIIGPLGCKVEENKMGIARTSYF